MSARATKHDVERLTAEVAAVREELAKVAEALADLAEVIDHLVADLPARWG